MKQLISVLLVIALLLGLCACARGGAPEANAPASASDKPDVELYLTADQPLPILNKEVPGSYLPYDEEIHLNVFLPDGVEYHTEGGGFNNWTALHFAPTDGSWKVKLTIGQEPTCSLEWGNMESHPQDTSANKLLIENAKYNGFNAKLFADEGKNWKYDHGIYLLVVDFGEAHVGRHTAMAFEVTGGDGCDKPGDFLRIPELAAVLARLTIEEGSSGNTWSQNGVTCTFPDSFQVSAYSDRGWSGYAVGKNGASTHVSIYTSHSGGQTPEEVAANVNPDLSEREWAGRKWVQTLRIPGEDSSAPHTLSFLSAFSDRENLRCDLRMPGYSLDELLAYADGEEFASIMSAVDASVEARQALMESDWDRGAANGSDFELRGAWIAGYTGSETDLIIPEHIQGRAITGIAEGAFEGANLTSVQIPDTVATVSRRAFANCQALREVRLSENLELLGTDAFENTAITAITLPRSLADIYGAFGGCKQLESVEWLCSMDIPSFCFASCTSLRSFTAEGIVAAVGANAFNTCSALESIALPQVTAIGFGAFANCEKLKDATFGELKELGEQAFLNCGFEKIGPDLIGAAAELPDGVFDGCGRVSEIRIPAGVKKIAANAFRDCGGSLAQYIDLYLPAGLETIEARAFSYIKAGNVYFDKAVKDLAALPAWDESTGPNFSRLMGNFVFPASLYAANKDALAAYCDAIPGVGAGKAADTPADTAVKSLVGAWTGTMEIDDGPRAGSYAVTGDFDYTRTENGDFPYIEIFQEGVEDAIISFWVEPKLETGCVHPNFWMNEVGWFLDHDLVEDPDWALLEVANQNDTVAIEYDYTDGYTCHVSIHLTKD